MTQKISQTNITATQDADGVKLTFSAPTENGGRIMIPYATKLRRENNGQGKTECQ